MYGYYIVIEIVHFNGVPIFVLRDIINVLPPLRDLGLTSDNPIIIEDSDDNDIIEFSLSSDEETENLILYFINKNEFGYWIH